MRQVLEEPVFKEPEHPPRHFNATLRRSDKALIISFRVDLLDSEVAEAVKAECQAVIREVPEEHVEVMVLSFERVSRIDSRALGMIISVWKFISASRGSWTVCMAAASPQLENFIPLCKLHHIFNIYRTVDAAIAERGVGGFI